VRERTFVVLAMLVVLVMMLSVWLHLRSPVRKTTCRQILPTDPSTLPQVPGCSWYPVLEYPGIYEIWCGSDELGWYQPYEWHQLTGIWPSDYGLGGG